MQRSADVFSRSLIVALGLACGFVPAIAVGVTAAQVPSFEPADRTLPIELDAAYSEFDRRNNRLIFKSIHITQGELAITADEAMADPADFENSTWVFTGNVLIDNLGTRATCDRAEMKFRENELLKATLSGSPARFVQARPGGEPATEGRGRTLEYDLEAGTIRMTTDAFLSDGVNEISGSRIAYDLRREVVTAGDGTSGQVRMKITPQPRRPTPGTGKPEAPPATPPLVPGESTD